MGDADRAQAYGAGQAGFGGAYVDGDRLVVLFTENLDEHRDSLRRIVDEPDRLLVRAASRTIADVQSANARISNRLFGPDGIDGVSTVGVTVHDGEFVVEVGIDPYNGAAAERIRAAAAPDEVLVRDQPRPRLF